MDGVAGKPMDGVEGEPITSGGDSSNGGGGVESSMKPARHSKSNVRKSNSIELNPWIEFD